jgi:hypothetical protein
MRYVIGNRFLSARRGQNIALAAMRVKESIKALLAGADTRVVLNVLGSSILLDCLGRAAVVDISV